jgi:hypothetical protein
MLQHELQGSSIAHFMLPDPDPEVQHQFMTRMMARSASTHLRLLMMKMMMMMKKKKKQKTDGGQRTGTERLVMWATSSLFRRGCAPRTDA